MNVRLQLKQSDLFLKLKFSNKILIWSSPVFMYIIVFLLQLCIQKKFYGLQTVFSCLWLAVTCVIWFLVNFEITQFQVTKLNWMKMLGLSNASIFYIAIYNSKYTFLLVMFVYSVISIFLVDIPLVLVFFRNSCGEFYR